MKERAWQEIVRKEGVPRPFPLSIRLTQSWSGSGTAQAEDHLLHCVLSRHMLAGGAQACLSLGELRNAGVPRSTAGAQPKACCPGTSKLVWRPGGLTGLRAGAVGFTTREQTEKAGTRPPP